MSLTALKGKLRLHGIMITHFVMIFFTAWGRMYTVIMKNYGIAAKRSSCIRCILSHGRPDVLRHLTTDH